MSTLIGAKHFLNELQSIQEFHQLRKGKKLYFFVLSEARWGHDLIEYLCAIKHASDNNYDVAFICTNSRNTRRLRLLTIENINVHVEFINLLQIAGKFLSDKWLEYVKRVWIQDSDQLKNWMEKSGMSSNSYPESYYWPYSTPLRIMVHNGGLSHSYFHFWKMNRKKYDYIMSYAISCSGMNIMDSISQKDIQMTHNLYPELDAIREDFYSDDRIVIGMNIRNIGSDDGRRDGRRDSSVQTLSNIFSLLENCDELNQARIVFFASKVRFKDNYLSKFSKVKFSVIPSYNEKWGAIDRSLEINKRYNDEFTNIEQLLIRYSNIIIVPDSGGGLLPIAMGKISIMCDSYNQTSPVANALYLPKGMVGYPTASSSEMLNIALKQGLSNPEVNKNNSLEQLLSALRLAYKASEANSSISDYSKKAKYDTNMVSNDIAHFDRFLVDTEYSRGVDLAKPRYQVERDGQLIYY